MGPVDEFLRRFAASPMHVLQFERLLDTLDGTTPEAFAAAVIGWDRDATHPEATRIALELLVEGLQRGRPPRLSLDAFGAAILSVPAGTSDVREALRERLETPIEN